VKKNGAHEEGVRSGCPLLVDRSCGWDRFRCCMVLERKRRSALGRGWERVREGLVVPQSGPEGGAAVGSVTARVVKGVEQCRARRSGLRRSGKRTL